MENQKPADTGQKTRLITTLENDLALQETNQVSNKHPGNAAFKSRAPKKK